MQIDPRTFKCRNTGVLVELLVQSEEAVGGIFVPVGNEEIAEAIVLNVGPDCIPAAGGQAATHDLKKGQRILIQHQRVERNRQTVETRKSPMGYPFNQKHNNGDLWLFEQSHILAILEESETAQDIIDNSEEYGSDSPLKLTTD